MIQIPNSLLIDTQNKISFTSSHETSFLEKNIRSPTVSWPSVLKLREVRRGSSCFLNNHCYHVFKVYCIYSFFRKTFEKRIDMNLKVTLNFDVRQRCGAAPKRIHVGGECFNNLEWNHRQSVAVLLTWEFASQKMIWIHILQRLHQSTCEGGVSVIYFFNVDMEREKRSFVFSASF